MILGPVPCQGCRLPVVWTGKRWRTAPLRRGGGGVHRCPPEAHPRCGALMPKYHERCARFAGHAYEHRSAYALENARSTLFTVRRVRSAA